MKSEVRTVEGPPGRLAAFNAKVAGLAKRAARVSVPPITVTEIGRKTEKHGIVVSDGLVEWGVGSREVEVVTFSVEGETPTMPGGWTLLGVLEFTEGGVLVTGDDERLAPRPHQPPAGQPPQHGR